MSTLLGEYIRHLSNLMFKLTSPFQDCWELPYWYLHAHVTHVSGRSSDYSSYVVDEAVGRLHEHRQVAGSNKGI